MAHSRTNTPILKGEGLLEALNWMIEGADRVASFAVEKAGKVGDGITNTCAAVYDKTSVAIGAVLSGSMPEREVVQAPLKQEVAQVAQARGTVFDFNPADLGCLAPQNIGSCSRAGAGIGQGQA